MKKKNPDLQKKPNNLERSGGKMEGVPSCLCGHLSSSNEGQSTKPKVNFYWYPRGIKVVILLDSKHVGQGTWAQQGYQTAVWEKAGFLPV